MEQRQFNLFKSFSLISLIAVVIAAILLGWLYRSQAVDELKQQGEMYNVTLAKAMSNAVWSQVSEVIDYLPVEKKLSEEDITYSVNVLDQSVKELIDETNIVKVKIFDTKGRVIYSTNHEQIGNTNNNTYFYEDVVAKGDIYSGLDYENGTAATEDGTNGVAVLSSYLPIRNSDTEKIEGVLKIYSDVTATYKRIQYGQFNFIYGVIIILSMVYFALFFVVRHADMVIKKQNDEREQHLHEIESVNQELDEHSKELAMARDQALDASKAKSTFLANMSHELRTPLNAIIGYSEMMAEEMQREGRDSDASDLSKIKSAGTHLLSVINDILDLSKIEAGRMDLHLEEVDVRDVIHDVVETVTPLADKEQNRVSINIADDITGMLTDLTRMRQVLLNLLDNSCKFTKNGVITLDVQRQADDPEMIVFTITDTGVGMDDEHLENIFEAFKQADSSTTKEFGGTGLGLTISKRFCEMLGGSIHARSQPDIGSTFKIILPERSSRSTGKEARPTSKIVSSENVRIRNTEDDERRKKVSKVLVIDDDIAVSDLVDRTLTAEGFDVNIINNARDAIYAAQIWEPDVILLDVMMPEIDGWAILKNIKSDDELSAIPVIMMTVVDNYAMADSLGADGFVVKPINRKKLKKAITLCLRSNLTENTERDVMA